jgi:SEC-C motif
MKTWRDEDCPCGSGKRFKKCCMRKKFSSIPCAGPGTGGHVICGRPSEASFVCTVCLASKRGMQYGYCAVHKDQVRILCNGHIIRTHPETVPQMVENVARNPEALAVVREEAKRDPARWKKLVDAIDALPSAEEVAENERMADGANQEAIDERHREAEEKAETR